MLKNTLKTLLAAGCCWAFALQAASQHVARVSMTVGEAQRIGVSGRAEPLLLGALLQEQDRIITGKDAMVILVFSDQARVALRPESELVIRSYKIDPSGTDTQMHLDLVRGTVRQISGQAAHRQPERYRLNTPIAAIGVRGTDFLAKASERATEAYVHEGAIVVSPFGNLGAQALSGPAGLSAGHGVQYSRLQRSNELERHNVSQEDAERFFGIRIAARTQSPENANASTGPAVPAAPQGPKEAQAAQMPPTLVASVLSVQGKDAAGFALQSPVSSVGGQSPSLQIGPNTWPEMVLPPEAAKPPSPPVAEVLPPAEVAPPLPPVAVVPPPAALPALPPVAVLPPPVVVAPELPPVAVAPPLVDVVPELPPVAVVTPPVVVPELPSVPVVPPAQRAQLVWGRFDNPQALPLALPLPYAVAQDGRHPTVGALGQYTLWRDGVNGSIDKSLRGQAQFALSSGEGFYQKAGSTAVPLNLTDPTLQIDFDRFTFKTLLGLSGAGVVSQVLSVGGRVNDEGVFSANVSGQRVAGAVSHNGKEAGYLFNISDKTGSYQGITLWNAQ